MALFGRVVVVEFGQEGAPGVQHRDLRVSFTVAMDKTPNPHTATIQIYNLNPLSLGLLEGERALVRLLVGYGNSDGTPAIPRLIFQGNPVRQGIVTRKQGPDRVTTLDLQDGGRVYQQIEVSLVYAQSTTASAVVQAVAAQLGLPLGQITVAPDITYPNGGAWYGSARDVLTSLARSLNARWFITDGVLTFIPAGQVLPGEGPLFSSVSGNLVGSPGRKQDGRVEVVGLLDSSIRPGKVIKVQAAGGAQLYTVDSVRFEGDSGYDQPFYVRMLCRPLV